MSEWNLSAGFVMFCIVWSIPFFHELGHYVFAKIYGREAQILYMELCGFKIYPNTIAYQYDQGIDYSTEFRVVSFAGIITGFLPVLGIIYLSIIINDFGFGVFMFVVYILTCSEDVLCMIEPPTPTNNYNK